jgi:hypothetical protein
MWNMIVALPISMPHMQVIVYGIELTGDTPRFDFTESAIPIVIIKRPIKYIGNLIFIFFKFIT